MNNSNFQIQAPKPNSLSQILNPQIIQNLYQENQRLKEEIAILKNQINLNNSIIQDIQNVKKELEQKILELQQQVYQKHQELEILKNSQIENKIQINNQSLFEEQCRQVQQQNILLMKQLDELRQNKQIVRIECKPKNKQNISEETVHLSFTQTINHYQFEYQRKDKKIEFQGYGNLNNQGFIFRCCTELSRVPKNDQNPQIIQNDKEIYIKFQYDF